MNAIEQKKVPVSRLQILTPVFQ